MFVTNVHISKAHLKQNGVVSFNAVFRQGYVVFVYGLQNGLHVWVFSFILRKRHRGAATIGKNPFGHLKRRFFREAWTQRPHVSSVSRYPLSK